MPICHTEVSSRDTLKLCWQNNAPITTTNCGSFQFGLSTAALVKGVHKLKIVLRISQIGRHHFVPIETSLRTRSTQTWVHYFARFLLIYNTWNRLVRWSTCKSACRVSKFFGDFTLIFSSTCLWQKFTVSLSQNSQNGEMRWEFHAMNCTNNSTRCLLPEWKLICLNPSNTDLHAGYRDGCPPELAWKKN